MPPPGVPACKFFLSYRRMDDVELVTELRNFFAFRYGEENVFLDTADIPVGDQWKDRIARGIKACDALVVIIGKTWVQRLRDHSINEFDPVRMEIALALTDRKLVFPICIDGAPPPKKEEIHYRIRDLLEAHVFELRADRRLSDEVRLLFASIDQKVAERGELGKDAQHLDEQPPAAGLALGYFVNFVRPAVRQITALREDGDQFRYDIEIVDRRDPPSTVFRFGCDPASRTDLKLHIVIPPRLALLTPQRLGPVKRNLHQARISTDNLSRPFVVDAWKPGDAGFQLIDFPNTLTAVEDWLQRRLPLERRAATPGEWQRLEAEQLRWFETMLVWWIEAPQNGKEFRDRVEVIQLTKGQDSFTWLEAAWQSAEGSL